MGKTPPAPTDGGLSPRTAGTIIFPRYEQGRGLLVPRDVPVPGSTTARPSVSLEAHVALPFAQVAWPEPAAPAPALHRRAIRIIPGFCFPSGLAPAWIFQRLQSSERPSSPGRRTLFKLVPK